MANFVYSDTHYNHKNIIKYSSRPFDTVEEMNEKILWGLEQIPKGSTLYFLGDMAIRATDRKGYLEKIKERNIQLFWILGNHDHKVKEWEREYAIKVVDTYSASISGKYIFMCHYPMVSHNRSHYNTYQLYGHHHTDVSHLVHGKKLNVAADVLKNDFIPVAMEVVLELLDKKEDNWDYKALKDRIGETE